MSAAANTELERNVDQTATIVGGFATVLACLPLLEMSLDPRLPIVIVAIIFVLAGVATLLRSRPGSLARVPVVQTLLLLLTAFGGWAWAARNNPGGLVDRLRKTYEITQEHLLISSVPLPTDDGSLVLIGTGVGIVALLVDLLLVTGRFVLPTALPLIAPFVLTAALAAPQLHWYYFATAIVSCLMVITYGSWAADKLWPRGMKAATTSAPAAGASKSARDRNTAQTTSSTGGMLRVAAIMGAIAIAFALLVGTALPHVAVRLLSQGRTSGPVELENPKIDLEKNLRLPEDQTVLKYQTEAEGGTYLRTTTLTNYDGQNWTQLNMELKNGVPRSIPGVKDAQVSQHTSIQFDDFASIYLPLPYAPTSWQADGLWAYDPVSLTVINTSSTGADSTRNLAYTVESTDAGLTPEALSTAHAGTPPEGSATSHVPDDLPQSVIDLTNSITGDSDSDGVKAIAIQNYLNNPAQYSYSLNAPAGDGYDILTNFLFDTRSGYCVHYSTAMAVMARVAGIPARVAIGFTPGRPDGQGSWEVTAHDAHAWPELYFEDYGWVRFEPTVTTTATPDYTDVTLPESNDPGQAPSSQADIPSARPSQAEPSTEASPTPEPTEPTTPPTEPEKKKPIWPWFVGGAVLLAALTPALIRLIGRALRSPSKSGKRGPSAGAKAPQKGTPVAAGTPSSNAEVARAWRELGASAADMRIPWPAAAPQTVAAKLGSSLNAEGRAALERIAENYQRSLFDQNAVLIDSGKLASDVATVRSQWWQKLSTGQRIRAALLPASLLGNPAMAPTKRR